MGYYIQVPMNQNKAEQLVDLYKGTIIDKPKAFEDIPPDKALICVISNTFFDAAAFCYSGREFKVLERDYSASQRPRKWVLMDLQLAIHLSGFDGEVNE